MWRLSLTSPRFRRWVLLAILAAAAAFMLPPVFARNAESDAVQEVTSAGPETIGSLLATEYQSLMGAALAQARQRDVSGTGAIGNGLALDAARELERAKLDVELRLLHEQLEHADTSVSPTLRRELAASIENLQRLSAPLASASLPAAPEQGGEVQR